MKEVAFIISFHTFIIYALGVTEFPVGRLPIELELNISTREDSYVLPLGGGIPKSGLFYTTIKVGDQKFKVIVDTGSSTLYLTGKSCKYTKSQKICSVGTQYYEGLGENYDCSQDICTYCSNRNGKQMCSIKSRYGDGSEILAHVTTDIFVLESSNITIYFGQAYEQSEGFLSSDTDGLLGLAYPALSSVPPVFDTLVAETNLSNIFSMCFNEQGGSLVLGGYKKEYSTHPLEWTPIIAESYYAIHLLSMKVGSEEIDSSYPLTIVDSGSTLILLPNEIYTAWKLAMQVDRCHLEGMCGENTVFSRTTCWLFDQNTVSKFPTMHFTFPRYNNSEDSIILSLTPDMYFLNLLSTRGSRCRYLGISESDQPMIILGDTLLQNYHTVYDRDQQRVGFSIVNRETCNLSIDYRNLKGYMVNGLIGFVVILGLTASLTLVAAAVSTIQQIAKRRRDKYYAKVSDEIELTSIEDSEDVETK